jgi:hypothetical protein
MDSQGERLRAFFQKDGVKFRIAAKKLDIHVNTLRNWFELEELKLDMFARLAKQWPRITKVFPEVGWNEEPSVPSTSAAHREHEAHLEEFDYSDQRYFSLLNKYNELLEKHILLLEKLNARQT